MSDEAMAALALLRKHVEGACGRDQGVAVRQNAPLYLALCEVERAVAKREHLEHCPCHWQNALCVCPPELT